MYTNCGVEEDSWESLGLQDVQPVLPKGDQSWVFIGRTDVEAETPILVTWCEELTHWKRLWCWERLRAGGEGDGGGWDGWMASRTQWIWVWVDSGSWWWTGRPGVLRFMGLQRVRHDWATELNWTDVVQAVFSCTHFNGSYFSVNSFLSPRPSNLVVDMCPHAYPTSPL